VFVLLGRKDVVEDVILFMWHTFIFLTKKSILILYMHDNTWQQWFVHCSVHCLLHYAIPVWYKCKVGFVMSVFMSTFCSVLVFCGRLIWQPSLFKHLLNICASYRNLLGSVEPETQALCKSVSVDRAGGACSNNKSLFPESMPSENWPQFDCP